MVEGLRRRLGEREAMEGGVTCPNCGSYTSFGDILATGRCSGRYRNGCETVLELELVVE